nr:odorant receptor 49a-like [Danaus plexippus plexippus]
MLVGQILYILKAEKIGASFLDVVNAIPTVLIVFQVCLKTIVLTIKKKQLRDIILDIGKEWPDFVNEEKSRVIRTWTKRLKIFDNGVLTHLCIYIACDLVLVDLIFDLSTLLCFVQIDLKNLRRPPHRHITEDDCDDVNKIARKHQTLLRLTERLNDIFGPVIFTQLSFSSIVICCYGFLAIIANGMFLKNITASFGIMFAIFVLAWPGQKLIDTSSGVAEAAYQCDWYERNNKFRKYISIMVVRSRKPCKLSALGFSDLTLEMFSKVISTSWSYLSLLNQMYKDFDP